MPSNKVVYMAIDPEKVKGYLENAGISMSKFSEISGICGQRTFYRYMKDKRMPISKAKELTQFLSGPFKQVTLLHISPSSDKEELRDAVDKVMTKDEKERKMKKAKKKELKRQAKAFEKMHAERERFKDFCKGVDEHWDDLMPMMAMEEAGELIRAVSKVERAFVEEIDGAEALGDLIDEIGDMYICLEALREHYAISIPEISDRIAYKMGKEYR